MQAYFYCNKENWFLKPMHDILRGFHNSTEFLPVKEFQEFQIAYN
jgi:hypothetical protein